MQLQPEQQSEQEPQAQLQRREVPERARREQEALREKTRLQTRGRSGTDLEKLQGQEVVEQLQALASARAR